VGAGRQGAQAPYPQELYRRQRGRRRRKGKGGRRRGRKRKEPLDAEAGSATDYKPYNRL